MSEHGLERYLTSLGASSRPAEGQFTLDPTKAVSKLGRFQLPEPGLWAVKLVQGAVSAGATSMSFRIERSCVEFRCHGEFSVSASELLQKTLSGEVPAKRSLRHWVTGLRGALAQPLTGLAWGSDQEGRRETAVLTSDQVLSNSENHKQPAPFRLFVRAEFRSGHWYASSPVGLTVHKAICDHCRLCPVPVFVDSRLVSQQPLTRANGSELSRVWPGKPRYIEGQRCFRQADGKHHALSFDDAPVKLLGVAASKRGHGQSRVHWLTDGALVGPALLRDISSNIDLEVICCGQHARTDISDWNLADREAAFPAAAVLSALRQILGHRKRHRESYPQTMAHPVRDGIFSTVLCLSAGVASALQPGVPEMLTAIFLLTPVAGISLAMIKTDSEPDAALVEALSALLARGSLTLEPEALDLLENDGAAGG